MSAKAPKVRRSRFETLEAKQMLAGDVSVNFEDGRLGIYGDSADNQIAIHSGPEPGTVVIKGLDGTLVHRAGEPSETTSTEVIVEGVRHIAMRMGDGSDTVVVDEFRFRGSVGIGTGKGEDHVIVGTERDVESAREDLARSVAIGGYLNIVTGEDGDSVVVNDARIVGRLTVLTDGGNDRVRLGSAPAETDPAVTAAESTDAPPLLGGALRVESGISVSLGDDNDRLALRSVVARGIWAEGGLGEDTVGATRIRSGILTLAGGRGDSSDRVTLTNVHAGHAQLLMGAGDDRVEIVDSVFSSLAMFMGDGNDEAILRGNSARYALLLGGPGDQDALISRGNRFLHRFVRGFEVIPPPEGGEA